MSGKKKIGIAAVAVVVTVAAIMALGAANKIKKGMTIADVVKNLEGTHKMVGTDIDSESKNLTSQMLSAQMANALGQEDNSKALEAATDAYNLPLLAKADKKAKAAVSEAGDNGAIGIWSGDRHYTVVGFINEKAVCAYECHKRKKLSKSQLENLLTKEDPGLIGGQTKAEPNQLF